MILNRLMPARPPINVSDSDAASRIDELYSPPRPDWLRINLVVSADGSAAGPDGTSESLTGGADRRILGAIRRVSNVVLIGASSVRVEGYRLPKSAALAIVSSSGDLSGHRLSAGSGERIVVLCPASAHARAADTLGDSRAQFVLLPVASQRIDPSAVVAALRCEGFRSIVCEGGPNLVGQLIEAGLVDEICLTTSPLAGGTYLPPFGSATLSRDDLRLVQRLADDRGYVYERLDLSSDGRATL